MIITVVSFKGGVAKTTTAVHLAAFLQERAPTLLIDGDDNRSASDWASRGQLPFKVVTPLQMAKHLPQYKHCVIDTQARPKEAELKDLADGCDLFIIPTTPDALALKALAATAETLAQIGFDRFKVLLTIIPPRPSHDGEEARASIREWRLPIFKGEIRRRIAFQKAALAGVPVYAASDPRAAEAWADYVRIGKELMK